MSKTIVTLVILGVLVIGGYFIFKAKSAQDDGQIVNTETSEGQKTETSGKKMAFSEFVKQGGSYKCEVKQNVSDMENNGTVYVSGSNVRGEFSTIAEGRTMETSFISKDGWMYNWSSALPNMGFKAKIVTSAPPTSTDTSGNYSWNANQIGDYNCEAWASDQSKFTVPTNITFKEFGVK